MNIILGWIQNNHALAYLLTWILSIGGVSAVFAKYSKQIRKDLKVANDILSLVNDVLDAADDNVITPEEVQKLKDDILKVKGDTQ